MERYIYKALIIGVLLCPVISQATPVWEHQRVLGRYVGVIKQAEPAPYRKPTAYTTAVQESTVLGRSVPGWEGPTLILSEQLCYTPSQSPQTYLGRSIGLESCK